MERKYPIKTPELLEAKKAIFKFLQKHNLNPRKDYSKHPTFGKEFRKLLFKLNKERDKISIEYPLTDIKNLKKYVKMKRDKKLRKEAAKATKDPKVKKVAKEKKSKTIKEEKKSKTTRAPQKYDYPLINGREMLPAEKKKYRAEQRKANSDKAVEKKTPKAEKKKSVKVEKKAFKLKKKKKDED